MGCMNTINFRTWFHLRPQINTKHSVTGPDISNAENLQSLNPLEKRYTKIFIFHFTLVKKKKNGWIVFPQTRLTCKATCLFTAVKESTLKYTLINWIRCIKLASYRYEYALRVNFINNDKIWRFHGKGLEGYSLSRNVMRCSLADIHRRFRKNLSFS